VKAGWFFRRALSSIFSGIENDSLKRII